MFEGFNQFINWVARPNANKMDKIPVGPDGSPIDPTDPRNWRTQGEAILTGLPVGFVFTKEDPYFFVDVDEGGLDLIPTIDDAFKGCYKEVSQSGKGLHVFGRAPAMPHRCKNVDEGLELYTEGRFVALTGDRASGSTEANGETGLQWLIPTYFKPTERGEGIITPIDKDDAEIVKIAKRSNPFSTKARFDDLFAAKDLGRFYPSADSDFDWSSADAALCSHLAFFTGRDPERIERIWATSALAKRDKFERDDYRERTIANACALCKDVYKPRVVITDAIEAGALDVAAQCELFKGMVYVISNHEVYTPRYGLLKPDKFKSTYSGRSFAVVPEGRPSKNAFETFTESHIHRFPKAYGTCFRPEETSGAVLIDEGREYVNTYSPAQVERKEGDPTRFLQLLEKQLPDKRDRVILLSYMAACVQHIGVKFQWAPLLQGTEGNGKTFLATFVEAAVGKDYSHRPNANDLGNKFTGWLNEKLFISIEELFTDGKGELREVLKPLITNRRIEIQRKGVDQVTGDNRANFFLFSNHKDAIQKSKDDRRYCVFYSAQQSAEDINAAGMGGNYFPSLWKWAQFEGGYAIITNYLLNYAIPDEFNPAGACHRAPITSSTREAYELSLGPAEQEVKEAIGEGRSGFRGGFVSSVALDILLHEKRRLVALNKRRTLLAAIGYAPRGRVNNPIGIDGNKKPTLYTTTEGERGIELLDVKPGADLAAEYERCQGSSEEVEP